MLLHGKTPLRGRRQIEKETGRTGETFMTLKITYYSESDTDYVKAVKKCKTLTELKQIVTEYRELVEDAYKVVKKMDDASFEQFRKGRNKKDPTLEWMEKYGAVLLPKLILLCGMMAVQFHVPFGTAYIRYNEVKKRK
jgi:mevalonate kinase